MSRPVRWLLGGVAAVAVLAAAALAALPRLVDTPRVQSLLTASASQALGRPVRFRSLSVSMLPYPVARLGRLEVAEDPAFGGGAFLRLDDAQLRLKLWPLLRARVEFATLVLERPTISLVQATDGRWNFASLGASREPAATPRPARPGGGAAPAAVPVSRVVIADGVVTYETRGSTTRGRLEKVDATLSARAGTVSFRASARLSPGDLALKITDGLLTLAGRSLTDAAVRAQVQVEGADVGPVVAVALGPEPGISGALTGRLAVAGTLGRPTAKGEVELRSPEIVRTNPGCPAPARRRLALSTVKANVSWEGTRLLVRPLATGLGGGSIGATVTATPPPRARVELADLGVRGAPLERVLVDFLCEPYAVTGPLDLTGRLELSPADPAHTLSGSGKLRVGPGRVVGARALSVLGGLARLTDGAAARLGVDATPSPAPLEFDSITASYEVREGVATTRDLVYTSRALRVRVAGQYALPTGRLDADVVLDHGLGRLLAKVTGTAASPSVRLSPVAALRQVDTERAERRMKDLLKRFH